MSYKDAALISNVGLECFNSCRITTALSAATSVRNQPIEPLSLEAALVEVAALILTVAVEDTFDGLVKRCLSEERAALRVWPTQFRSSARLEDMVREPMRCITAPEENAVISLFGVAGRVGASSPDSKAMEVFRTVGSQSVIISFRALHTKLQ